MATATEVKTDAALRSALGHDIYTALLNRGHTPGEIAAMSPEDRFDEYCGYHLGDRRWGEDLRATLKRCRFDAD